MVRISQEMLDVRRLLCPLPVIRVQDRVQSLAPGTLVEVVATDPGVIQDIPAWCRLNGHTVKRIDDRGHEITIFIEVGNSEDA